jgi:hypothetical protein
MKNSTIAIVIVAIVVVFGIVVYANPTLFNNLTHANPTIQEIDANQSQWLNKTVSVTGVVGMDTGNALGQTLGVTSPFCLYENDPNHMNTYILDIYAPSLTSTANNYLSSAWAGGLTGASSNTVTLTGHLGYFQVVDYYHNHYSFYAFVVTSIS